MTSETTNPTNKGGADLARPTCDDHMAGQAERERREMTQTFRSRDEQVALLSNDLAGIRCPALTDHQCALRHIAEAEARGAAEERLKDAEWTSYYIDHRPGSGSPPYAVRSLEQCAFPEKAEPVYTRPANVAALEARVQELERGNITLKTRVINAAEDLLGIQTPCMGGDNFAVTICSHFEDCEGEEDDNGWHKSATNAYEEIKSAIVNHFRAALKREGGM